MSKQSDRNLTILITGVSSGIGKAVANYFIKQGHTIYGIDLNSDTDISNFFKADISNEMQLLEIKKQLKEKEITFDAILNFAGIHMMGSFIETDFNKIQKLINVNLLGTILVNKTFYSLLAPKGKILVTSSEVASHDPMPFNGIYHVSKTAIDCYSQSLRQELNLKGNKVITLRPGAIKTALCDESLIATQKLCDSTILYKNESNNFLYLVKNFMGKPLNSEKIAKLVYKIITKKHNKLIYKIHYNIGLSLLGILPKRMQCFIIKKLLNKKAKKN